MHCYLHILLKCLNLTPCRLCTICPECNSELVSTTLVMLRNSQEFTTLALIVYLLCTGYVNRAFGSFGHESSYSAICHLRSRRQASYSIIHTFQGLLVAIWFHVLRVQSLPI